MADFQRDSKTFEQIVTFTRASTATYYDAQGVLRTAAIDEPRLTHDPVTGESLGLLIEGQRTNLLLWSEDFTQGKTPTEITIIPESNIYNGSYFTKLVPTTSDSVHKLRVNSAQDGVSQVTIYAKASGYRYLRLIRVDFSRYAEFDLQEGVVVTTPTIPVGDATSDDIGADIEHVGNGVYRCTLSQGRALILEIQIINDALSNTFAGDGTSGIEVFGFQDETGSFPTSYIKTEASQVTRSADNARVVPVSLFSYNASAGKIIATAKARIGDVVARLGDAEIMADTDQEKEYSLTYDADPSATELEIMPVANGYIKQLKYEPR